MTEHAIADAAFCKALVTEELERFDILHDAVVVLYESQDYDGLNRLMALCYGTKCRGWIRSVLMSVGPIKRVTSEELYDRLIGYLRKGNEERRHAGWIRVGGLSDDTELPEEDMTEPKPSWYMGRRFSKDVLVKVEGEGAFEYRISKVRYYEEKPPEWWTNGAKVIAWMRIPQQI